jgi:alpha-mannosidase
LQARENSRAKTDVIIVNTDKIFHDIDSLPENIKRKLPVWQNELVMTDHGVGSYTSRTVSKRWNRRGEQLALTAERVAVFADLFGVQKYPKAVLEAAWKESSLISQ